MEISIESKQNNMRSFLLSFIVIYQLSTTNCMHFAKSSGGSRYMNRFLISNIVSAETEMCRWLYSSVSMSQGPLVLPHSML